MLEFLKRFYLRIGIDAAPPGTFVYSLHRTICAVVRPFYGKPAPEPPPQPTIQTIQQGNLYDFPVRKIAIVKGDHIGDLVFAIPAVELLRKRFPHASVTLICNAWNESLALAMGLFEKVVVVPMITAGREAATPEMKAETSEILGALPPFDIAMDMRPDTDTRWVLCQIDSRIKAGFYADTMPQDNAIILPPMPNPNHTPHLCNLHTRELLCLLANAVITRFDLTKENPAHVVLGSVAREHANIRPWSECAGPVIGINTGAGLDIQRWPLSSYVTLCRELTDRLDARIILFGTRAEAHDAQTIIGQLGHKTIKDMTAKLSLPEFAGSLPELDLFIGHDTGSTHIAASLGCPTLCLFTAARSYDYTAPQGDQVTVIRSQISCSHCALTAIAQCQHDHACMTGIAVDDVLKAAIRILASSPATGVEDDGHDPNSLSSVSGLKNLPISPRASSRS